MQKTGSKELLAEIGEYLPHFLKFGNIESFTKKIDKDLNIRNMKRLLRIHFVLSDDVIEFVELLPIRIRRIRTGVDRNSRKMIGAVKGKINWPKTYQYRYGETIKDETHFVVNQIQRNFNVPENLVLKELLGIIHSIVYGDLQPALSGKYSWIKEWISDDHLRRSIREVFLKNIYIRRISDEKRLFVHERIIVNAQKSRNVLYQKAARLLLKYRKLMKYELDPDEAQKLLKETFIAPGKEDVLFELYWTFKIISTLTNEKMKNVEFLILEPNNSQVAIWKDETYSYEIFHDSTANFSFNENWSQIQVPEKDGYLFRAAKVVEKHQELGHRFFIRGTGNSLWGGRPDIILIRTSIDNPIDIVVFIGEVKHTLDVSYAMQGLKELLEYMALLRKGIKGKYFQSKDDVFVSPDVRGWLFVDSMKEESFAKNLETRTIGTVSIVRTGEMIPLSMTERSNYEGY